MAIGPPDARSPAADGVDGEGLATGDVQPPVDGGEAAGPEVDGDRAGGEQADVVGAVGVGEVVAERVAAEAQWAPDDDRDSAAARHEPQVGRESARQGELVTVDRRQVER